MAVNEWQCVGERKRTNEREREWGKERIGEEEREKLGMRAIICVEEEMTPKMARVRKRWRKMAVVWKRYGGVGLAERKRCGKERVGYYLMGVENEKLRSMHLRFVELLWMFHYIIVHHIYHLFVAFSILLTTMWFSFLRWWICASQKPGYNLSSKMESYMNCEIIW